MEAYLEPLDVMVYEYSLVDFLGEDRVERELSRFKESVETHNGELSFPSMDSKPVQYRSEPFLSKLYQTRQAFDSYWSAGTLPVFQHLLDIVIMGHAVKELTGVNIIDPEGKVRSADLKELYADRVWNAEDLWDVIFELEVGSLLNEFGLDIKLVDEGTLGGPDIRVEGFDQPVWIECKRKRTPTEEEAAWEDFKATIKEAVWDRVDIGDDSFAVRISADFEIRNKHMELLSDKIAPMIELQRERETVHLDEGDADIELVSYYKGTHIIDLTEEQTGGLGFLNYPDIDMGNIAELARPTSGSEGLGVDLYGHLDLRFDLGEYESANVVRTKQISEHEIRVRNALMFLFDFPRTIDYVSKIESSIDAAKSNVSGRSPSIVCVHVPAEWLKLMEEMPAVDRPDTMQDERLVQSINGELKANSSINAVVLVSRSPVYPSGTEVSISRYGEPHRNLTPGTPLPDKMDEFLDQLVQNGSN